MFMCIVGSSSFFDKEFSDEVWESDGDCEDSQITGNGSNEGIFSAPISSGSRDDGLIFPNQKEGPNKSNNSYSISDVEVNFSEN